MQVFTVRDLHFFLCRPSGSHTLHQSLPCQWSDAHWSHSLLTGTKKTARGWTYACTLYSNRNKNMLKQNSIDVIVHLKKKNNIDLFAHGKKNNIDWLIELCHYREALSSAPVCICVGGYEKGGGRRGEGVLRQLECNLFVWLFYLSLSPSVHGGGCIESPRNFTKLSLYTISIYLSISALHIIFCISISVLLT